LTDRRFESAAEEWIAGYFNARHLLRTRDWVLTLQPGASEALRIAALTHDIERIVPGAPRVNPRTQAWNDATYLLAHSVRSARMVADWLEEQGADAALRAEVEKLILHHEIGGFSEGDVLQAADSLSFLEVNAGRARLWVEEGRCDLAQAQAKLDWMRDRIAVAAARPVAAELHAAATAALAATPV
jgi:hypothetical protein